MKVKGSKHTVLPLLCRILFSIPAVILLVFFASGIPGASKVLSPWQRALLTIKVSQGLSETKRSEPTIIKDRFESLPGPDDSRGISVSRRPASAFVLKRTIAATDRGSILDRSRTAHMRERVDVHLPSSRANDALLDVGAPLLVTEEDSTRAIALESVTFKAEPFNSTTLTPWSSAAGWRHPTCRAS